VAEKLPAIDVDVAFVTCHWKLLQVPADGAPGKAEIQVPAYDPVAGGAAGATGTLGVAPGIVGRRISERLSTAHAVPNVEAARVTSSKRVLFMSLGFAGSADKIVRARTELCMVHL
jgi:hypothetical protein